MANKELKKSILEIVDNQIKTKNPKCTNETFGRLVASGYTIQEAKERIAEVLLDEIYIILKEKKTFNEERFAEQLKRIESKERPN